MKLIKINEGGFEGEKSISIRDYDGVEFAGFFEDKYIKDGKLEVRVISEKENSVLIGLPGRTLEGESSTGYMDVKKEDIEHKVPTA